MDQDIEAINHKVGVLRSAFLRLKSSRSRRFTLNEMPERLVKDTIHWYINKINEDLAEIHDCSVGDLDTLLMNELDEWRDMTTPEAYEAWVAHNC